MIPLPTTVHGILARLLDEWEGDGRDVTELRTRLGQAGADLAALVAIGEDLTLAPVRPDWPYEEPDGLEEVMAASRANWEEGPLPVEDAPDRVRTGFLGRVAGCILGKPLELGLTRRELQGRLEAADCWPLTDYLPESALDHLPARQPQWRELAREHISHVAVDDDLNYTVLAMLALEEHGDRFTHDDLAELWRLHLPVAATFGPERARLAQEAVTSLLRMGGLAHPSFADIPLPGSDLCGALIRADAYGYACAGDPGRAARLAHRDASFTHRRTGVYGAMWVAATIALAMSLNDPLVAARRALDFVPKASRFHAAAEAALDITNSSTDWSAANEAIVELYPEHGHCRILQEVGTLVVTFRFARDVGDGICLQVMQANDTDSFGATAGSILGTAYGPDALDQRWIEPFQDTIHVAMAGFEPPGLLALADRMARLAVRGDR